MAEQESIDRYKAKIKEFATIQETIAK